MDILLQIDAGHVLSSPMSHGQEDENARMQSVGQNGDGDGSAMQRGYLRRYVEGLTATELRFELAF